MRVLILSWEYPPVLVGGLGRHVHSLSLALVEAGHDVTVVTRHAPGAELEEFVKGVHVVRVPEDPPRFPLSTSTLLAWTMAYNHALTRAAMRIAVKGGFDMIHAHDWLVAHTAIALKEQLEVPLVTTIHATEAGRHQGWLPEDHSRFIHSVEWWLANESNRVVVCSHYMRWEVNRLFDVPYALIDVVVNGVDAELWQTDEEAVHAARRRYAGAGPLIGFAGRLVYEKGVQDLIRALPQIRGSYPELRLVVAGDGPHRHVLQQEAERLDLHRAVSFTGFLGDELPAVMAAADAFVIPSIYEPFGMVALEASAAGVPIAAAATGGLKEIVEPWRTGMTFPAGDPDAIAGAVHRLLHDPPAAQRMVRTARHVAANRFSWSGIAHRTARVYGRAAADASTHGLRRAAARAASGAHAGIMVPTVSGGNLLQP